MEENTANKAGRKPSIPMSTQLQYFKKFKDELIENGYLKTASAQVYKDLYDDGLEMPPKNMIRSIERNAIEIFGETVCRRNPQKTEPFMKLINECTDNIYVTIGLSDEDKQFFLVNSKNTIEPKWSHRLAEILNDQLDPECVFNFHEARVVSDEIRMIGECKECKKRVIAKTLKNANEIMVQRTGGTGHHTFTENRRIGPGNKEYYLDKLKSDSAFNVRNSELNKIIQTHGFEARVTNVPSASALRALKCRANKESDDVLTVLHRYKYLDSRYEKVIHKISSAPFQLLFYTPYQVHVYKQLKKIYGYVTICIDATGSLIDNKSLLASLGLSGEVNDLPHIFLYLVTVKNKEGACFPIAQFLSAEQSFLEAKYFLEKISEVFGEPDEVHIDQAAALIKGCVCAYTSCRSTKEYIDKCFQYLTDQSTVLPQVLIRNDIAHLVKSFQNKHVFKQMPQQVKQFYLCVMGFILQCDNFDVIKITFKHLINVCSIQCSGKLKTGIELPTETSINALMKIVATHKGDFLMEQYAKEIKTEPKSNSIEPMEKNDVPTDWFKKLIPSVSVQEFGVHDMSDTMRINAYFCKNMVKFLQDEFNRLPLWTAAMKNPYNSPHNKAITSDIESSMNKIKNVIMRNVQLPCRADTFFSKFVESVNGQAKDLYDKLPKELVDPFREVESNEEEQRKNEEEEVDEQADVNEEENSGVIEDDGNINNHQLHVEEKVHMWKRHGANKPRDELARRKANSMLNIQVLTDARKPFQKLAVMPSSFSQNIRNSVLVQNTGCFDAMIYCIAAQYIENPTFCSLFKKKASEDLAKYMEIYLKHGATYTTRSSRSKLLQKVCIPESINGFNVINVNFTIQKAVELFLENLPSVVEIFSCGCSPKNHMFIPVKIPFTFMPVKIPSTCAKCKQVISVERKMNEIIFMNKKFKEPVFWESIEQKVAALGDKEYVLVGVIEERTENDCMNWIAHVKRYGNWYSFKKDRVTKIRTKGKFVSPLLIYAASESDTEIGNNDNEFKDESPTTVGLSQSESSENEKREETLLSIIQDHNSMMSDTEIGNNDNESKDESPTTVGLSQSERNENEKREGFEQTLLSIIYDHAIIMFKAEFEVSEFAQMPITVNHKPYKIDIVKIASDGNCLFRSLAHQIFLDRNGTDELESRTRTLRKDVVDFIDKNFEMFQNVMEGRILDEIMAKNEGKTKNLKSLRLPKNTTNLRRQLLNDLQTDKFWGGSETIYAVSQIYKCNIICFNENAEPLTVGNFDLDFKRCAFVGYNGNHYDSPICMDFELCRDVTTNMVTNALKQIESQI